MTNLVIVESPNKCKKIQSYLGDGYIVKASMGHVRDLPSKVMGVDLTTFKPTYEPSSQGRKTLTGLRKLAKSADKVYLATDPDREGEAIAWHLQQALNLKSPIRITFNAITKKAVIDAVNTPGVIDINLVSAQEARRILDRLVGYTVSPALSNAYGQWITAGRVQSIASRLVSDLEKRIQAFKSVPYLEVFLTFDTDNILWRAQWIPGKLFSEGQKHWVDRPFAERVASITDLDITSIDVTKMSRKPPAPFTTPDLIQGASVALKMDPKKCMQTAQKLFEQGLITYHRTDSPNLSEDGISDVINWLTVNNYGQHVVKTPNVWKEDANAQAGHEAIRPTAIIQMPEMMKRQLNKDEFNLYNLIWLRVVASQMKNAEFEITLIKLLSSDKLDGNNMEFISKGEVIIYEGWKILTKQDATDESVKKESQKLPNLSQSQHLITHDGEIKEKKTKPPSRYTQASLVKKLKTEGIGRPATYATTISNIIDRNYVSVKKSKLYAEEIGMLITDTLSNKFQFMEFSYTRDIEKQFDLIAKGKEKYINVVSSAYAYLKKEMVSLEGIKIGNLVTHSCPKCNKDLRLIQNKFWGCSGHPDCSYTAPNDKNKPGIATAKKTIDESYPCSCNAGYMQLRGKKSNEFWGCSSFPKCKVTLDNVDGKPGTKPTIKVINAIAGDKCPDCDSGKLINKYVKSGKNEGTKYLGCSNQYEKEIMCKYFSWVK
ncbi:MAG: type I DNA topoisomerase [Pseudomonadota bacterium]